MLDANSALDSDDHLREFLGNLNLVHDVHVNNPAPSTYIGSSARRIDYYIFGCSRILPASISRQGIPSYFEGSQLDHRSLSVDLNLSQLLGDDETNPTVIPASPQRWLSSGNPKLVELYEETMRVYY